jgi:hypothetical protein
MDHTLWTIPYPFEALTLEPKQTSQPANTMSAAPRKCLCSSHAGKAKAAKANDKVVKAAEAAVAASPLSSKPLSSKGREFVIFMGSKGGGARYMLRSDKTLEDLANEPHIGQFMNGQIIIDDATCGINIKNGYKDLHSPDENKVLHAMCILSDYEIGINKEGNHVGVDVSMHEAFRRAQALMDEWFINTLTDGAVPECEVDNVPYLGSPTMIIMFAYEDED